MPLTEVACKSYKPKKDADYKVADEKGLSLLVKTTGAKWWRFSFSFAGKRKTLSMGTYPETSLKEAREKRDDARKMIASGIDPSANRKAVKSAQSGEVTDSFKVIALEWLAIQKDKWVKSHYSKVEARMHRDVLPWLGNTTIRDVKASDILKVLRRIEERDAIETARRALQNISQVFKYAKATDRADLNPAPDLVILLKKPKEKHMAAVTEPAGVGELLRQIDSFQGTFTVRCALLLAPLVFVRPGELRQAEWKDINLDTAEWRFRASKTHQGHIVPLSRQAVDIFKDIFPLTGHGRYVFPCQRSDERPMSNNAILAAFRRMGIGKDEMTGHGFRAMARTLLSERLRYPDAIIEHQLAHQVRDVHGYAYNRTTFLEDRQVMMQQWADYLDNLREGKDIIPVKNQDAQAA
ncbi:integrase [Fluviicoccus keumensis]|uniref:Integrase n=1 Tax=Fluviicoccus keumensis TaxID=1435465 RepID=A0A4Q7Z9E8_9GAMM|nr:integrase arm-type DNA-binding domain-containing protein [Fluviicoccus keumensis]RZU47167.1 integrase [Fluviicoccus keumensis]